MRIALDFDGTFTADPDLWLTFIDTAKHYGHMVYIVTARDYENDGIDWSKFGMTRRPCDVIFCDGRTKRKVTAEYGIDIDVWIDDNPAGIILPTSFTTPEQLAAWRATDEYRASQLPITGESRGFKEKAEHVAANRREDPQGNADNNRRPRLLSRRDRSGGGSLAQG